MKSPDRFLELARSSARFLAHTPDAAQPNPVAVTPPIPGAGSTGGRSRNRAAGGSHSSRARNTVRVLSDATRAAIGATREERAAAMRADLEALVEAKKAGEEAQEAETIQAEFGFDELEPLPPGMGALPPHILAEQDAGIPRDAQPYWNRD